MGLRLLNHHPRMKKQVLTSHIICLLYIIIMQDALKPSEEQCEEIEVLSELTSGFIGTHTPHLVLLAYAS